MVLDSERRELAFECGLVHLLPDEMAQPGLLSCRDVKKFNSAFVFRSPDHPKFCNENQTGCLRDCQVESPEMSYGQCLCTAELAPALGQIKGYSIANLFEAICCGKASPDLHRDPSGHPAGSGLNRGMS
jgi:hypothetical protein